MSFNTKSQSLPLTLQKFMYYDKFLSEISEPLQSPLESRFLEEFIQIKLLSKGAFGHVYGAIKKMEDKKYAVKCIKLDKNHEKVAQDSTREVKVLSELKHRNIVFYYNAWLQEHPPPDWQDDGTDDENSDMSFDSKRFKEAEQRSEDASVTSRLDHLAMSSKNKSSSDSNSDVVFLAETNDQMSRQERLPLSSSRHAESSIQPSKNYTYLYIQMELCRKENLASWLKTRQPSQLNVDQIYREILSAVKYLHSQNIVHRDLKPNNIFFDRDWSIKVGDFGLSKWMTTERESHSTGSAIKRKQPGMFDSRMKHTKYVGTKPYMAPEQENGHKYNHKVDVYALAIILFELKAGPFNTGTERAISIAELKSFRFPQNFDPDTKLLLYAMLSEDPVHRPEVSVILSKHFPKEVEPINPRPIKQRNALASARPPIRHAGDIFHSKLLMLFLIRGIRLGYQFQLGANMPGLGGIFDDLIFKYCANLSTGTNVSWRYRIVQVKYKQEEAFRITANELLSKNSGDFSLEKYFHSFVDIKKRGGDIQNYIISTNVGFDAIDLIKRGFQLVPVEPSDNILTFENPPEGQKSACYRLQITDQLREKCSMEWSDIYLLAITLLQYSQSYDFFALRFDVLRRYHVALVSERVIDSDTKKFHLDFVNNVNLLQDAQLLRFIICKLIRGEENLINWTFIIKTTFGKRRKNDVDFLPQLIAGKDIDEFFDKLIFAVDMPNIADLDHILTDEIGQHFKLLGPRMLQRVWELSHQKFLSSEDGLKIIEENKQAMALNDLNVISVDYRNRLCKNHRQDEPEDLEHLNRELMQFLYQSSNTNILTLRVITSRPKNTAVKVFSALETLLDFRKDATYLTVSSKRLEDMDEMKQWKKALEEGPYQLLIVVCKDNVQFHEIYDKLILPEALTKEVIIICKNQESVELDNGQSNTLTTADGWMEIKDNP